MFTSNLKTDIIITKFNLLAGNSFNFDKYTILFCGRVEGLFITFQKRKQGKVDFSTFYPFRMFTSNLKTDIIITKFNLLAGNSFNFDKYTILFCGRVEGLFITFQKSNSVSGILNAPA